MKQRPLTRRCGLSKVAPPEQGFILRVHRNKRADRLWLDALLTASTGSASSPLPDVPANRPFAAVTANRIAPTPQRPRQQRHEEPLRVKHERVGASPGAHCRLPLAVPSNCEPSMVTMAHSADRSPSAQPGSLGE
jgi:hypothetical protein